MSVKIEIILNDPVVDVLVEIKDQNQRALAVRDVLLSSANDLVAEIATKGLKHGITISRQVGLTINVSSVEETDDSSKLKKV